MTKSLILFVFVFSAFASEDHDKGENEAKVGPNKAVQEWHSERGFRLSSEALKSLQIKTSPYKKEIPSSAFVQSRNLRTVFVERNGYFLEIDSDQIETGDQIVVEGGGLLKITKIFLEDESEYGHGH